MSLNTHDPDWRIFTGAWQINTNRAAVTSAPGIVCQLVDGARVIRSTVRFEALAGIAGIVARYNPNSDEYWLCQIKQGSPLAEIIEVSSAGSTVRASAAIPAPASGIDYDLEVSMSGSTIAFTVAGVTLDFAAASLNPCGEWVGLYGSSTGVRHDDFEVTA